MSIIADSICVKYIPGVGLLAGNGNYLRFIHLNANGKTVDKHLCLEFNCKIYGICWIKSGDLSYSIIVYGGRELAILKLRQHDLTIIQQLKFRDWISAAHLYGSANDILEFCVLSSHSVAFHVKADTREKTWRTLNKSSCVEKATLYCSRIFGRCWSDTTILGGTALGELIIWTVADGDALRQVYQRHSGHNGVIFSIDCNLDHNLITTTSDDRSVKVWRTTFSVTRDWETCKVLSSKSMFGHTARIFQHKIIVRDSTPYIVTVGEDANICIWTIDGDLIFRKTLSTEATLWNLDYADDSQTLFICGSDSNIHQIQLKHILDGRVCQKELLPVINCGSDGNEEFFAKIRIISRGILIGLTNLNRLLYRSPHDSTAWTPITNEAVWPTNLKCTLLEVFENTVAIAGYQTAIVYYYRDGRFDVVLNKKLSNGLIRSLKFLSASEFLVCDDRGDCTLLAGYQDSNGDGTKQQWNFVLPPSKERWITAACKFGKQLLISDRIGHLHLFQADKTIRLLHTLKHVHGKLGCTSIEYRAAHDGRVTFTTAGHDGTLKTIVIADNYLQVGFTKRVPIAWIDKVIPSTKAFTAGQLIAGFNDNHFILGHENGSTIFEYGCGGGHRYWDLFIDHNKLECYFYYIRKKNVHRIKFRMDVMQGPYNLPRTRWHVRSCNAMHVHRRANSSAILISGGDDNLLMFHTYDATEGLVHRNDMALHVSNIKAVCSVALSACPQQILVFSAGGRAQICANLLDLREQEIVLRERTNFMLNFADSTRKRLGKSQTIDSDPETRFMSLVAYNQSVTDQEIQLIAACSDGYIRQFQYENNDISLTKCIFYGRCILHVHQLRWNDQHLLFTMATDGLICFWNLNTLHSQSVPIYHLPHHDSGINSFDVMLTDSDGKCTLFLATGGDDQSIVISKIKLDVVDGLLAVTREQTVYLKDTHSAQVNGVKFMPQHKSLYSFSVDQVIHRIGLDDFGAERIAWSSVSDAKGLTILSNDQLIVYGSGMELIECRRKIA